MIFLFIILSFNNSLKYTVDMKPYFVKLVIAVFFFGVASLSEAQVITEDEVDFQILKWHFHYYPNSETVKWQKMGDHALQVSFGFEEKIFNTVYLTDGTRMSEEVDLTKEVPVSVQYYLDEKYGKYKVQEFKKVTSFKDDQIYYAMSLRTKDQGEESLSFDEHLIPVDFALISSID